ncbi:hypothetical protein LHK28_08275, partial [Staphylococcus argenteus]|nr:hypothetical protein [Staphylococcus argenteus]
MKMRLEQAFFQYWGPNIEGEGKSAVINVKVGGGPNIENFKKKFYTHDKSVGRANIEELRKESSY